MAEVFQFQFNPENAMETLKAAIALLTFHLELCSDLNICREYEERIKNLGEKAKHRRQDLLIRIKSHG